MSCLIITADDGFYAEQRDTGIVFCMEQAGVSDVSVLMNGCVANKLIHSHPQDRVNVSSLYAHLMEKIFIPGLHLNITEGTPLSPVHKVPDLVDSNGQFLGKQGLRARLQSGPVDPDQIEMELNRQFERFRVLFNSEPTHVDGHQHIQVLPVLCRILPRRGIRWIRVPDEPMDNIVHSIPKGNLEFLKTVSYQSAIAKPTFFAAGLRCTDAFIGMALMGQNQTLTNLTRSLENISPNSVVEFMTHPGYPLDEANAKHGGGCGTLDGGDEFSRSPDRKHELDFLTSPVVRRFHQENGYKLVCFRDYNV